MLNMLRLKRFGMNPSSHPLHSHCLSLIDRNTHIRIGWTPSASLPQLLREISILFALFIHCFLSLNLPQNAEFRYLNYQLLSSHPILLLLLLGGAKRCSKNWLKEQRRKILSVDDVEDDLITNTINKMRDIAWWNCEFIYFLKGTIEFI